MGRGGPVRGEIVIVLLIWFCIYVLFDVVSTFWLINNTMVGISGEMNPLGRALFSQGLESAYLAKILGFVAVSVVVVYIEQAYGRIKWVREVTETVLLVLITISLLAALNNYDSILVTFVQRALLASAHAG